MVISFRRFCAWAVLILLSCCILSGGVQPVWQEKAEEGIKLPILMYHHVRKDSSAWGKFVISPQEFEEDLKFLKENGYQTIGAEDLVKYAEGTENLPQKPIMITVDDGYLSAKEYMAPLLGKYQMKAVLSVIGKYSDDYSRTPDRNVAYAHLTWTDISELSASGVFEIQNHTYDMHKNGSGRRGSTKRNGESEESYRHALTDDLEKTRQKIEESTGIRPICFTYPYGFISKEAAEPIREMGYRVTLTCNEGISLVARRSESLLNLKRCNRPHGTSAEKILLKFYEP